MFFIFHALPFFQPPASSGRKSLTPRAFNKPLPFSLALSQRSKGSLSKRCRCLPPLQMAPPDSQGNSSFACGSGCTPIKPRLGFPTSAPDGGFGVQPANQCHQSWQTSKRIKLSRKIPGNTSVAVGIIWQLFRFYSLSDQNGGAITVQTK